MNVFGVLLSSNTELSLLINNTVPYVEYNILYAINHYIKKKTTTTSTKQKHKSKALK